MGGVGGPYTRACHRQQRERQTLTGLLAERDRAQVRKLHQDAQRLLRPLLVVNPYARALTFRDDRTRRRRDHLKYLTLIRALALLHQHQRPLKTVMHQGERVEAVAVPWFEIIKELDRDPNFLQQLDWRKLEELIAGAYRREGWPEVILTPRSGDRGRDIIASRPGLGAIRFYDQVKAYKPGHKVPADDVRALVGVLTIHQNVSKAVITTTALFAPGVHDEMKALIPYRLELKDGPKLHQWLMHLGAME